LKTDSLFYRLFKEFPGIFFELIGASPETAVNYQFTSVEVKQTAFRIDGNTARLRIFHSDFEDVETRYIASLRGFGFLEFS
jgi:predicted transposase YdaD